MQFVFTLFLVGLAFYLYFWMRRKIDEPLSDVRAGSTSPVGSPPRIRGDGQYSVEAVGESFYKPALRSIFGVSKEEGGEERRLDGMLVLEDDNPHDRNAVAITLQGKKVAHLSREVAAEFRNTIMQGVRTRSIEFSVSLEVWVPDDPEDHYSVRVDLPGPS